MQPTKNYYNGPESDCGNYQDAENPHYESVNPYEVKHNPRHLLHYILNWIVVLLIATALVVLIVNFIS